MLCRFFLFASQKASGSLTPDYRAKDFALNARVVAKYMANGRFHRGNRVDGPTFKVLRHPMFSRDQCAFFGHDFECLHFLIINGGFTPVLASPTGYSPEFVNAGRVSSRQCKEDLR
jgi:hypothetical protein